MSYNGYKNYETWCVNLWIDNSECSHVWWRGAAAEAYRSAEANSNFSRLEVAADVLADRLRDYYGEQADDAIERGWAISGMHSDLTGGVGVFGDLLRAALSEVNWDEIAFNLLEGVEDGED